MNPDPKALLDLLGLEYVTMCTMGALTPRWLLHCKPFSPRAPRVLWVPRGRKGTWVTQERWELRGPEALVESWEHR